MKHRFLHLLVILLAATSSANACAARVLTVGSGSGCAHDTIQSALDEAQNGSGDYIVRITRSIAYNNVHAHIALTSARDVVIEGGYATCSSGHDNTRTVLSASGTSGVVLNTSATTGGIVHLRWLEVRGATFSMNGGGGIVFYGDGVLEVSDSFITQNRANHGGGINAVGTGSNAELVIGANVVISNNTANISGGGIYASQIEMSMTEPGSILMLNHADGSCDGCGYGGGLYIDAGNRSSYAYIGSSGVGNLGAIWGNTARYGGGVALGGKNDDVATIEYAELHLFSSDPQHRGKIAGNVASIAGGAIHGKPTHGMFDGQVATSAYLWNAELDGNNAPNGAAVHLDGSSGTLASDTEAYLRFNDESTWPAGAAHCPVGGDCGRITNNNTGIGGDVYTDGAVIEASSEGDAWISLGCSDDSCGLTRGGVVVEGNRGGRLLDSAGYQVDIDNALIDGNQFSKEVVRAAHLQIHDATIAGNSIGADTVLSSSSHVEIKRSLLWQPGRITLQHSGTMAIDHVFASEIDSLGGNFGGGGDCGGGVCAILGDPQFVDPAHGDYGLRVSSPAIDMAAAISGDDRDVSGRPRDQNLPHTNADNGVRDIGAFERVSLQPMVLNGNFDFSDLRLWTWFGGEWDGTQNAAGTGSSGSWHFNTSGLTYRDVNVGEQCVRLPGPGHYAMNGWGKGGGSTFMTRDYAVLAWEYRHNGGTDCSNGAADASGELTLGGGSNWGHPAQPASVEVPEGDFVAGSPSIRLRLIARDGSMTNVGGPISAWFDGITLDPEGGDTIFADDFELD